MKVRFTVETTFEDGNIQRREISRLCRAPDKLGPESLGLRLDEAKNFLKLLQESVVQDQIAEALKLKRTGPVSTAEICVGSTTIEAASWILHMAVLG